jgi:hypothetical protein
MTAKHFTSLLLLLFIGLLGSTQAQVLQAGFHFTRQGQIDSVNLLIPNYSGLAYSLVIGYPNTPTGPDTITSDIHDLSPLYKIRYVGDGLIIRNNPRLKSLYGLHNLDTIYGGVYSQIVGNDSLTSLSALSNLRYMGSDALYIQGYSLESLHGLEGLRDIGNLSVAGSPRANA